MGNVKQEQIRGKAMSHCILPAGDEFIISQTTQERMQDEIGKRK